MAGVGYDVCEILVRYAVADNDIQAYCLVTGAHARLVKTWSVDTDTKVYTVGSGRGEPHCIKEKNNKLICSQLCKYKKSSSCHHRLAVRIKQLIDGTSPV
jgi:hypothetical protein